jgi:hypothetical protein
MLAEGRAEWRRWYECRRTITSLTEGPLEDLAPLALFCSLGLRTLPQLVLLLAPLRLVVDALYEA